ncbi:cyclic nucleotide-binding domain-containing protein [Roseibium sp.]|uniref:cyclic nucleotide-binding domain-containing protein n=1 Tax=Roseibium sp. TaxID=1936156 RepID=UPI003A96DD1A
MSLAQDIAILQQIPMLADFADDQLRLLAFSAESMDYRDGMTLFDQGERADGGLVVAEGEVSLQLRQQNGFEETDVASAGALLGEAAMLVDTVRPCRAVAKGHVRIIRVRRALFKRMIQEYPELAQRLFDAHASRYKLTAGALAPIADRLEELEQIATASGLRRSSED